MNKSVHKYYIPHTEIDLYGDNSESSKRLTYQNIENPDRWLKHFPNLSMTSQIGKRMSELSREMENMLILENGEKFMKDGLETKEPNFLVN